MQADTGRAIKGAAVQLEAIDMAVETDANGIFRFSNIPPGELELSVSSPGYTLFRQTVEVSASAQTPPRRIEVVLTSLKSVSDEISITASYSLLKETPSSSSVLTKEEVQLSPHFGDDLYRAISILPGTATSDLSAGFTVRGGFQSETLVLFDGLELFEPFHLKELEGGFFSILDPEVVGGVELISSGFGAEYGNRQTAVLEMTSADWDPKNRVRLSVSFSNLSAAAGGFSKSGKTDWLASLRRGYLDILLKLDGDDDPPGIRYWDAFGKLRHRVSDHSTWSLSTLSADDTFDFEETDDEPLVANSSYGNINLWLRHQSFIGSRWLLDSAATWTRLDNERRYDDEENGAPGEPQILRLVDYDQSFDILTIKQDLVGDLTDQHHLKAGWSTRSYSGEYDYSRVTSGLPILRGDQRFVDLNGPFQAVLDTDLKRYSAYLADRLKIGTSLVLEAGIRIDRDDRFRENKVSPRLNGIVDLKSLGILRFAAGRFRQSHQITEISVSDGDLTLYPEEVSDLLQLGYERSFVNNRWLFRTEVYHREVDNPRPRYQNLFDSLTVFPELESDRVRLVPDSAETEGAEFFLSYRGPGRWSGWISYVASSATDEIDGREVPRFFDQAHAVTLNLQFKKNEKWTMTAVLVHHTGWPTTEAFLAIPADGSPFAILGEFNQARLPDYQRLDLRFSRNIHTRRGDLVFFIDIQNTLNRENVRGFDLGGAATVGPNNQIFLAEETSFGILPSLGLSWHF